MPEMNLNLGEKVHAISSTSVTLKYLLPATDTQEGVSRVTHGILNLLAATHTLFSPLSKYTEMLLNEFL